MFEASLQTCSASHPAAHFLENPGSQRGVGWVIDFCPYHVSVLAGRGEGGVREGRGEEREG